MVPVNMQPNVISAAGMAARREKRIPREGQRPDGKRHQREKNEPAEKEALQHKSCLSEGARLERIWTHTSGSRIRMIMPISS